MGNAEGSWWVVGVLVVALWSFGCGDMNDNGGGDGNGNGGGNGDGESMSVEEFESQFERLISEEACEAVYACPKEQDVRIYAYFRRAGADKSTCVETVTNEGSGLFGLDLQGQIDRGLVEYDGTKASACLDAIRDTDSSTCTPFPDQGSLPEPCFEVLSGTQSEGDPCTDNFHCQSGACDETVDNGECYGTCTGSRETVGEGKTCDSAHRECDASADLICEENESMDTETCKTKGGGSEGDTCDSGPRCGDGLACVTRSCQEISLVAEGESCDKGDPSAYCKPGLVCRLDSEGGENTKCLPAGGEGDPCLSTVDCDFGLYCDSGEGACKPQKEEGASCENANQCTTQYCVEGSCATESPDVCEVPAESG